MSRPYTTELPRLSGRRVRLAGWLHAQRRLSRATFLVLRDARGVAQVVLEDAAAIAQAAALAPESVLEVEGRVVTSAQAPGGVELHETRLRVLSEATLPPPVELRRPTLKEGPATLLDHATVALRHPRRRAISTIAAASTAGFRASLDALGFTEIQTSKLVGGATESGANVFAVDYFGRQAFLAQSPQLYKQIMVGVHERVYEVGPVFRAEPHDTARHLAEYTSLDAELGFIASHHDVVDVLRAALAGMVETVRRRAAAAVELVGVELPAVPERLPVVHFADAQALIDTETGERLVGEPDLAPAHERRLGDWARREHGSELLVVEGYPMAKRPFYTLPDPDRPGFSRSFDVLFRGVELVTGGQRLHRHDDYLAALAARGHEVEPLRGYLEAFRHGMPPHGGFAIGLERWLARLVGAGNVREVTLFPRDLHRLAP